MIEDRKVLLSEKKTLRDRTCSESAENGQNDKSSLGSSTPFEGPLIYLLNLDATLPTVHLIDAIHDQKGQSLTQICLI